MMLFGVGVLVPSAPTLTARGGQVGDKLDGFLVGNSTTFSSTTLPSNLTTSVTSDSNASTGSTSFSIATTSTNNSSSSIATTSTNSSITTSFTNSTQSSTTIHTTTNSTITSLTTTLLNATTTHSATNSTVSLSSNSTSVTTGSTVVNSTTFTSSSANATLVQNVSARWNPYTDFYSFINWGLFNDGGDCYGFSTTSVLYFMHYQLGDQTYPFYPEPAGSVSAMPGQTGYYTDCFLGSCFNFSHSDTFSQSTFPIYIHERYGVYQLPANWENPSNERAQVQMLMQSIQAGIPVVLALGPADGHAVVAWGYQEYSNGNLVISISDPNYTNMPRYAYFNNGQFSYVGNPATWSTFSVISPEPLQWNWLSAFESGKTITAADYYSNQYYTYVFSSVPVTISSLAGQASFGVPGDSLSFNSSIAGVVGFEEGGIQVYAIPLGLEYTIHDPGAMSSRLLVVIPQNETSSVGYELDSASSVPLSLAISPSLGRLNVTSANEASLSVALFSVGLSYHSLLNATSIPVASSQTAVVSVPNWAGLNSPNSAADLQIFSPGNIQAVTSFTLTSGQQNSPVTTGIPFLLVSAVVVVAAVCLGVLLFAYSRRRKQAGPDC